MRKLMTYASENMTERYLDGHDTPWTDVHAGIALTRQGRNGKKGGSD
jgi:hypothetical protein